jgi:prepilin-type N-terminal cleavage/methylation domain-containing protein
MKQKAFTIVELLIVIVVIGILAAISLVAYNGVQNRAKNSSVKAAVASVQKLVEAYNAEKGSYPSTGGINSVYTDSNCTFAADSDGQKTTNWVPDLAAISSSQLPQANFGSSGRANAGGCYAYSSDGNVYIITAWNAKAGGASTGDMYRRIGYREGGFFSSNQYICNHNGNIGGINGGTYRTDDDIYKHSFTVSNITSCNETPPAGA